MDRPLAYYAVYFFTGLLSALLILDNCILLGAVLGGCFLFIGIFTIPKGPFILSSLLFFLGALNLFIYYRLPEDAVGSIRLLEKKYDYYIGEYNSRRFAIKGNFIEADDNFLEKNLEGYLIKGKISFKENRALSKGLLGEGEITSESGMEEDLITKIILIREEIYNSFKEALGEERAAVVSSLCFGNTQHLEDDTVKELNNLGILHVISVSGFHVLLIYNICKRLFKREIAMIITLAFVIFTGGEAATLRAFIMLGVLYLGERFYKNYDSLSALSMAAIIILLFKPYLVADMGFSLSCLSTLGIIIYNKKIGRALYMIPKYLRSSLSITLSSQLIVFPYGALSIGSFSLGFIFGNLMIIPLYTSIIYISLFSLIFVKLPKLFFLLNKGTKFLFNVTDSWLYLLSRLELREMVIKKELVILYTCIFITLMVYRRFKGRVKYLPLFMVLPIMCINYYFYPVISLYEMGNNRYIKVSYKRDNYIFTLDKGSSLRKKLSKELPEANVISIKDESYDLSMKGIKVNLKTYEGSDKAISLKISAAKNGDKSPLYDIISMKKDTYSYEYYRIRELISYSTFKRGVLITDRNGGISFVRHGKISD